MVACPNCSTPNPDVARFCMSCGATLAAPEPAREARKVVTVVFADITGSTGLGERLDPEAFRSIMGRWFDAMSAVLERHGGSVEKFIGDAVVAVFGVPVVHEDDGLRAVRAAAEMTTALAALNEALRTERGVEIAMRVGVNTGTAVVGDARAGGSRATGDAVTVAARLQQAAEPGETLVGEPTWRLVREAVTTGEPREISVKGHEVPVVVRRLIAVDQAAEGFHRRVGGPMVGRDRELGILRAAFERAVIEERCVLVTVLGSAGVGKSRLVHEFLAGARTGAATGAPTDARTDATVLRGRCLPYGQGITWYPVAELLRSAVGLDEESEPSAAMDGLRALLADVDDAETILARLAETLGVATAPAPVEELFWGIRRFLEQLALDGPVVVVLDDLQWAEPAILDLVEHLSEWVSGVPLMLIAMARPELLDLRVGWGGGKPDATTFVLEPLPSADTEHLVEALLEGATIAPIARQRIAAAADGNPLYVEQVIEMLLDDGLVLRGSDGSLVVGDLDTISVPPTIQALLAARLDRLSDGERRTIERAAVVGKEFGQRDVSELTPAGGRADVAGQLMGLVRKELIRPDRRRESGGEAYRFRHLLIRDAAYDSLPKLERAELHEQFADWLERTAGDRLAELDEITGYHLDQARTYRLALGPDDDRTRALALRAGHRLAAAGRRSADRDEVPTAIRLLTQAEALLVEDPPARFKTLNRLVHVGFDEDLVATMRVAKQAEEVAAELGDHELRRARLWVSAVLSMTDPMFLISEIRAEAEAAATAFAAAGDIDALLDVYEVMVAIDLNLAHWQAAARWAQLGLKLAAATGLDQRREDFTTSWSNAMVWGSSDARESLAIHDELLASTSRRLTRVWIVSGVAILWAVLGDRDRAEAAHDEATSLADELGIRPSEFRRAYMRFVLDDLTAAIQLARQESANLERVGETGRRSTIVGLEAWILALIGDDAEAARAAEESRRLGAADDAVTQILWRSAMGVVLARRGETIEADRVTTELVDIADGTDSMDAGTAWLARGWVLSMAGRREESAEAARRARELFAAKGFVNGIRRVEALLGG
jgi:class 3 adenylate cyclase/tetratricopeptide (TPR) repeat protein